MPELSDKLKALMTEMDERIPEKNDREYLKSKTTELFMLFTDKLENVLNYTDKKVSELEEKHKKIEDKMKQVESVVQDIEKDIYLDENSDFEIVCPYCNHDFVIELDTLKEEVECPECHNLIELDWENEEDIEDGCAGMCSHCHEECSTPIDEEENEDSNNEDEDM